MFIYELYTDLVEETTQINLAANVKSNCKSDLDLVRMLSNTTASCGHELNQFKPVCFDPTRSRASPVRGDRVAIKLSSQEEINCTPTEWHSYCSKLTHCHWSDYWHSRDKGCKTFTSKFEKKLSLMKLEPGNYYSSENEVIPISE